MPYCPKCSFRTSVGDKFCAQCGEKIEAISETKTEDRPEWIKNPKGKKQTFWSIMGQSLKHTFFDNEQKLSKKRKIVNAVFLVAILILAISIVAPYLDSIKLSIGDNTPLDASGQCKYRLDAAQISISEVEFIEEDLKMNLLITNLKNDDVVIETLAKTYEFRFDGMGDTDTESVSMSIPSGKTLKLSFSVKKEPYLLGLDISGCEKLKISDWTVV